MTPGPAWAFSLGAGFALGSLPFGLWWGRLFRGIDVREHGSRNLGATNVFRVLGPAHGVGVLLLDAAKGAAAVLIAGRLSPDPFLALAAGHFAILGHMFSPWVGFRGGKGVATGLGVWLTIAPVASALALALWGITLAIGRRVSVASLVAAAGLPVAVFATGPSAGRALRTLLAAILALLVWARHRANIGRLLRREEPPLWGN
jgi:acyl phosphate:glycerol-3-phosphate acyltransferase